MYINSTYDNTQITKSLYKTIAEQIFPVLNGNGEYKDIKISAELNNGYKIEAVVSFLYRIETVFNAYYGVFQPREHFKFSEVKDKKETYKGKNINTMIIRNVSRYIEKELNSYYI